MAIVRTASGNNELVTKKKLIRPGTFDAATGDDVLREKVGINAEKTADFQASQSDLGKAIVSRITGGTTDTGAKTILGGGVTTNINQEVITGDLLINEEAVTGRAVTDDQNIPTEDTSVEDGLAAAINDYIAGLTASNQAAFEANVSNIRAEETTAIQSQEELRSQAQTDYLNALDEINKGTFDATQRAKVSSEARGIGSSQQAEGLQQGIAREGLGLRFKNVQDRTTRINNIVDRIAAIKTSTAQRITGAGQTQQAANLAAQAEGGKIGLERQFQVEDREDIQQFQVDQNTQAFENQLQLRDVDLANDLTKLDASFRNTFALAVQQNDWAVTRDLVNNAAAMSRLGVSNNHAINLLGLQQQYGFDMAELSFNQSKEVASLDFDRAKELARLGEDSQTRLLNTAHNYTTSENEARVALEYQMQNVLEFGPNVTRDKIVEDVFNNNKTAISFLRFFTPKIFGLEESQIRRLTDDQIRAQIKEQEDEVNNYLRGIGF